ncbi:MAG: hypothetical protein QXI09_01390 [Candidatus Aenigmatarchaeota archaeon]
MKFLLNQLYEERIRGIDLEIVKTLVSKFYGIPRAILDGVPIIYQRLPEIYEVFVRRVGNSLQVVYKPIGKILGLYDPLRKEIRIDYTLPYYEKIKTLIHEYIHVAQDYLGKLYKKSRRKIEEEAHMVSEYLSRIYNLVSQKYFSSLSYPIRV